MTLPITRAEVLELDAADELAGLRERFALPEGVVYLDGNSLGPPLASTAERLQRAVGAEWGGELVRGWNTCGWIDLPARVAARIAPLIGAGDDEVAVADSTSVNLFKLLAAAVAMRPGRPVILSEEENFPTDLYMAQGLAELLVDRARLEAVPRERLWESLDRQVAVLMLTHVDFRSGELHDMQALTRAAHEAGALALWDLAHSAGAVPVDVNHCRADFAVGCGYKYLNGGPGAPAFAYVARRHHRGLRTPLTGWMGHREPFAFTGAYEPAPGCARLLVGTPPILSLIALDEALELFSGVDVAALRRKSVALTELFIALVERRLADHGFRLASPREADRRGSQVSLAHPEGFAVMQALIARGVIGDFRAPDLLRFGFAPAYTRFVDVWDAVETLQQVMSTAEWERPELRIRPRVT
ncbi:MAG TPA: kynureninase [Candidatus Sulfomarinibacteraceae bacterium]|nr:kynureninase [Candidatus Sulfomarinibacteraceae bacterium]